MIPRILLLTALLGAGHLAAETVAERVARVLSPELRRGEARLADLAAELPELPDLLAEPYGERYGFRTQTLFRQDEPQWVQLDLGKTCRIDRLAVVPVHIPGMGPGGAGYGFPLRFRIEVADNPEMSGAVTLLDRTAGDFPNPGRYPLIERVDPVEGRYVRFTSTRHFPGDGGFFFALEEIMVFSGNLCVGSKNAGSGLSHTPLEASGSLELFPNWSLQRINDAQSALGYPQTAEPSPSQGYMSAPGSEEHGPKWLEVDLGEEFPIDEIRLVAVDSEDYEVVGGRGFPRELVMELWGQEGMVWRYSSVAGNVLGYPTACGMIVKGTGEPGRRLRVTGTKLWSRDGQHIFALAEVQVYSGGRNVAPGKTVSVLDAADKPASAGWAPEFAVDGFSSRHRLTEWPDYLDLIEQRIGLEREREELLGARERKIAATGHGLAYAGGGLGIFVLFGGGGLLARQRISRAKAVARLRDQIARDLHDDIGSNLGGIVLLSEMGSLHSGEPQVREDFKAIREAAEMTSQSMQDIVWLIQRENSGLRDLLTRMRHSARLILGEDAVTFAVDPEEFADRGLSLLFRRHFFLAFKESLNNVRKHAQATRVEVRVRVAGRSLGFSVRDNGNGFDPAIPRAAGHGLANLRRRAERIGGTFHLESSPGQGTSVSFDAPTGKAIS